MLLKTFDFRKSILRFTSSGLRSSIETVRRSWFSPWIHVLLDILCGYNHGLISDIFNTSTFLKQSNTTISAWTLIFDTHSQDIICSYLLLFLLQKTFVMADIWVALDYFLHGDANIKLLSVQKLRIRRIVQCKVRAFRVSPEYLA